MKSTLINRILLVLGFVGIFIAGYITAAHLTGAEMACGGSNDCGKIAESAFAKVGPIPVAMFGLLAYCFLTSLALLRSIRGDAGRSLTRAGIGVSGLGFVISLVFMALAFFVVKANCYWCIASAVTMTAIFFLHLSLNTSEELPAHDSIPLALVVGFVTLASLGSLYNGMAPAPAKEVFTIDSLIPEDAHKFGDPDAKVVIVEFVDLTCSHCRDSYKNLQTMLSQDHAKIQVVLRHCPLYDLAGHELSLPAAAIGEIAAEQGKFFQFVDLMYGTQEGEYKIDNILGYAQSIGLDVDEVKKRVTDKNDPAFLRVKRDVKTADEMGINQTPTFYIGLHGQPCYPAKINSFQTVMEMPEFRKLWDPNAPQK